MTHTKFKQWIPFLRRKGFKYDKKTGAYSLTKSIMGMRMIFEVDTDRIYVFAGYGSKMTEVKDFSTTNFTLGNVCFCRTYTE